MTRDKRTDLIHHPYQPPAGFEAMAPGVHKASTVIFPSVAALHARSWKSKSGYTYGLHGTPTTFTLEERIASLEGGLQTLLVPSGLAAITLVDMALLKQGDEVLIPENAYGPSKELARNELAGWGITHRFYDPMDARGLAALIGPQTRLLWLEAAGSVTMEFPDLPALVKVARSHGVTTALDNTWGAGVAFNPFDLTPQGEPLGVDVSVQALTKYASGGGDVLMGSVTTRDDALHLWLKFSHMRMGWGVGANDAELVLRSLPSLALRYDAQDAAARTLAAWWSQRREVVQVLHPALPGSPGHECWEQLCTRAAGLFSVVFNERYSATQVHAFVDALRLFKIGYSWAGPVSLAVPYDLTGMRAEPAYRGTLVRFSVGLEAAADLIKDSEQALHALGP
ncbi:MAG: cystathionine beta-lyase [Rhizobacter sp.]|nr:cystathionine beta-lyase [Rhizobacter sp.]